MLKKNFVRSLLCLVAALSFSATSAVGADILFVTPVFSAREKAINGITAEWLAQGIKEHGHKEVILCPEQEEVLPTLLSIVRSGDVVITLGAGNIYKLGDRLLEKLGTNSR